MTTDLGDDWLPLEALVADRLGLRADDGTRARLAEAARACMQRAGIDRLADYLDRLAAADPAALNELAQALTIGESYFLRGADHFAVFAEQVVPDCLQARHRRPRLRVLSAGCSSGEEIYSLAMILADQFPELGEADIELVGIDITEAALAKARRGIYTPWSLRDVPASVIARHFQVQDRRHELNADIRRRVRFECVNLLDPRAAIPAGPYDAIFCRNVLIYFTPEAMRQVIDRFEQLLTPGGYLFLGHSESLRGLSRRFRLLQGHDSFYYQRLAEDDPTHSLLDDEARRQYGWETTPIAAASLRPEVPRPYSGLAAMPAVSAAALSPAAAPTTADSRVREALALFAGERYLEAARQAEGEARDDGEAGLVQAAALLQLGRYREAQAVCERRLSSGGPDAEAACLLGLCREQLGDLSGAREQLQLASYLDGEFAAAQLALARIGRRLGDAAQHRRALVRAIQLLPHESPTRLLLFGGGFSAASLSGIAQAELAATRMPA